MSKQDMHLAKAAINLYRAGTFGCWPTSHNDDPLANSETDEEFMANCLLCVLAFAGLHSVEPDDLVQVVQHIEQSVEGISAEQLMMLLKK